MGVAVDPSSEVGSSEPPTVGIGPGGAPDAAGKGPPRGQALKPGQHVGRFVVLKTLGVGGMGIVVSAYDSALDRKVALKLLRPDVPPSEPGATGARASLLREAQAMARLRDPNVVTVFEVGEFEGRVFIAMEHVGGGTLGRWADRERGRKRGWERIVAAYVKAGSGLVAAHRHGLVHRDFKPANVLVEGDRVQVTDFGIASVRGSAVAWDSPAATGKFDVATPTVSAGGGVVGTVPYMAPEVIAGLVADARSDQFSFCVALFESLYGRRPFEGKTGPEVSAAITAGRICATDYGAGSEVPEWVYRAIVRGLDKDPANRWPSMERLLATLASPDDAEVGRRTRVVIAAGIGAAFVGLPLLAGTLGPPFDRSNYAGVLGQTISLIVLLLVMSYVKRDLVWSTPLNRRAFGGVLSVLVLQLPLELTNAALGVAVAASDLQHLVLWSGMATMFGVTLDRRFFVLALVYLLGLPLGIAWPEQHVLVLGVTNAVFIAFVILAWRGAPIRAELDPRGGLTPAVAIADDEPTR